MLAEQMCGAKGPKEPAQVVVWETILDLQMEDVLFVYV